MSLRVVPCWGLNFLEVLWPMHAGFRGMQSKQESLEPLSKLVVPHSLLLCSKMRGTENQINTKLKTKKIIDGHEEAKAF